MRPASTVDHPVLRRFVAQDRRPVMSSTVDFAALSSFHRALLVTDGTVTSLVEAYRLEPTATECLDTALASANEPGLEWLGVTAAAVVRRRVAIRGANSGRLFVAATSLLVVERLPAEFRDRLASPNGSIGTALIESNVETRRELLWYGSHPRATVSRGYRIFVDGLPALFVQEDFS